MIMDDNQAVKQDPDQAALEQWAAYARARDAGHLRFVEQAKMFDRYYYGDQWEESVVKALDAEMRPHTTVNLVLSTVNAVQGQYLSQRQDIEYKPKGKGATQAVAEVLTKLAKHVSDDSKSRYVEKDVVMDGLIQDRGFFDIRLDFGENLQGEIRETALDPVDVLLDPGARSYDPATWNEVFVTRWLTPDEIAVLYGQAAADKIRYINAENTLGYDSMLFDPQTFADEKHYYTQGQFAYNYPNEARRCSRARVIERQFYKFTIRKYFVDNVTGDTAPVPDSWQQDKIDLVAQTYNLSIVHRPERRVKWRITCDKFTFFDDWSPYRRFTVIPFFPYFRRGRPFGLVRNLIAPQDLTNKTLSQELHVVNTTANSGWMIESGTLANMTVQQLAAYGAKTGLVIEYQRGAQPPQKIQANQIPTGLDRLSQKGTMYFREISGVNEAVLGQPGREISGEALQTKARSSMMQMDPIWDNLALTRQLRAEFMLELFQEFYTEQRIFKITQVDIDGAENEEEVKINQQAIGEIVNDITVGEYSVVISARPTRDIEDESELNKMMNMRDRGVMIPDWAVVESAGLRRSKEIAEYIRRIQGAAEPTPEEIQAAQMQQELEMRRQMAELDELAARTQERLANAQKLAAEAESLSAGTQTDLVKFGAELRASMEKDLLDLQQKREELMTRIKIAQEKNQSVQAQAALTALTKRLDTEAKERIEERKAQASVASASSYGKSFNRGK